MKIPVILQHDEEDCGAACMAIIAHYYGLKLPLVKFRDLMCFSNNGTSVYDIVKSAENLNFKAMPMKGSLTDFSEAVKKNEIHLPCIALIKSKVFYHFIVIYKITKKNVYYIDPAEGRKKESSDTFITVYENVIIDIQPGENFKKIDYSSITARIVKDCIKQNRKNIVFLLLISVVITVFGIIASMLVAQAVGLLIESMELSSGMEEILRNVYNSKFVLILVSVLVFKFAAQLAQNIIFSFAAPKMETFMLQKFYSKLLTTSLDTITRRKSGELIARFTDIRKFNSSLIQILTGGISNTVFLLGFGTILFIVSPILFGVLLIHGLILLSVTYLFYGKAKKSSLIALNNNAKVVDNIEQSLHGIELIKGMALEEKKQKLLEGDLKQYSDSLKKFMIIGTSHNSIIEFVSEAGKYLVLCLGTYLCINGNIPIDKLILFFLVFTYFSSSLTRLVYLQPRLAELKTIFSRMEDIGESEKEISGEDTNNIENINGIQTDSIIYGYTPWKKIISDISLNISGGEKILLMGPNGGGKSTLAHLLAGDYKVQSGEIKYNGVSKVNRESIKKNITYVNQEAFLFHDSLYNNLAFGSEKPDFEKMIQVCELTGVNEIIKLFPEGFEHIINSGGTDLSSGQRQKIALARALLRDTPIYVFDESISNMDSEGEKMFLDLINGYLSEKTVIIISHRDNLKNQVNKVYHIEGGRVC